MKMKQILAGVLFCSLLLSFTACTKVEIPADSSNPTAGETTVSTTAGSTDADTQETDADGSNVEGTDPSATGTEGQKATTTAGKKTNAQGKTTTTKRDTVTTTASKTNTSNSLFKQGTKKVEEGLKFNGETFTMACGITPTALMTRQIKTFETQYNCKISIKMLDFDQYQQQAINQMTAGKSYDILELEGVRFPGMVIAKLCEPLQSYVSTADLVDPKNFDKGGFSEDLSMAFSWRGNLYGVVALRGYYGVQPNLMWYNKKLLQDAGVRNDPRQLYESGKWTFDALKDIADTLKRSNIWTGSEQLFHSTLVMANGGWYITPGDNPQANMTNAKVQNAYKYGRTFTTGSNPLINLQGGGLDDFVAGKMAFYSCPSYHYNSNDNIAKQVSESTAFSKKLSNLGVVPFPQGPDNAEYAKSCTWLYSLAAGVGSNPKVMLAYAKLASGFKSPDKETYEMSAADTKMIQDIVTGPIVYYNLGYNDGKKTAVEFINQMEGFMWQDGQDVARLTAEYNAYVKNCINVSLK